MTGLSTIIIIVFYLAATWGSAGYAYRKNQQLPADDPSKRKFTTLGVYLAPFMFPLLLVSCGVILAAASLLFFALLVVLPAALLVIRKPRFPPWLKKAAVWMGRILLKFSAILLWPLLEIAQWLSRPPVRNET